jgi:nitronate monooxygenase
MSLRTPLCDLLGIEVPIIQAPIGSGSGPRLASVVSNTGGLGMISVTWRSPDEVRRVVKETKRLTAMPFGVNLVLHWDPTERLQICLDEGVKIVSSFWGDPSPYVDLVHQAGALVTHTVGSAEEARHAVEAGVDVVIAQGWEAGGHVWGEVSTLALVPAVVDAVDPVPVVAAGGIGDGRGIASVLMLGAAGAWLGTRFIASVEAEVHQVHKEMVVSHSERDTYYGEIFDLGWPAAAHRVLRNVTVEHWEEAGRPVTNRPGEGEHVATYADGTPVIRYSSIMPGPDMTGNLAALAAFGGQSAGVIRRIQPAAEIIRELVDQARTALERGASLSGA